MQIKAHFSSLAPNNNKGFAQHLKQETSSRLLNNVYFLHRDTSNEMSEIYIFFYLSLGLNKPWGLQFKLTYQNHIPI